MEIKIPDSIKDTEAEKKEKRAEKMRTVKIKLPASVANDLQNAIMRDRIFLLVSYSNRKETRLYHRFYRKNFSVEDAIIACDGVKEELLKNIVEGDQNATG